MRLDKGIVVIGGGHGGSQIAASLREKGFSGPLTLITAEPDIPYQRPPLSKAFLKDPQHELLPLRPESFYEKHGITLRLGAEVAGIDRREGRLALAGGSTVPFAKLALAVGSRPKMPPIEGIGLDGVFSLRVAEDARRLRERLHSAKDVVVVGGGFIGLEVAATARYLGRTVTVLEAADRLMGRVVAPVISEHFLDLHRGWGADVRLNTPVGRIVGEAGRVVAVETAGGASIPADLALIGIGVHPNVELAKNAGLETGDGILVDQHMLTSAPEIVAIGDCVRFDHWSTGQSIRLESVQNAVDQGRTAALTLLGHHEPYRAVPWFWSDQQDVKFQMVGIPTGATSRVLRGKPDSGSFSIFHFTDEKLIAIDSVNRPADHVLGRHMIGAGMSPPPEVCADEGVDLKKMFRERAAVAG